MTVALAPCRAFRAREIAHAADVRALPYRDRSLYLDGVQAFVGGRSEADCPWRPGPSRDVWLAGWMRGYQEGAAR